MGVLARVFEEHGLVTTSISLVREHTEKVKPPRALFVPFPFGHPLGEANDAELQTRVIRAAFALLDAPGGPALVDYPEDIYANQDINLAQASSVPQPEPSADVAFELTTLRAYYEEWVAAHAGRTTVGVTRVDQRRFRGLVRLLEGYAAGQTLDVPEWNREVPLPQFLRWAADDLKAFYLEARMQQKPRASFQELNRCLWSETALSNLLRAVRDRMRAQGDPKLEAIAFGIAR
ncbi:MAG: hypothetical protein M3069_31320 [Chloroflexota bacterium]|nr:hypothetical protein [Chloroflexota bacterium]